MIKKFVALQVMMATRKKDKGQSLAEYGLILALIAVACIAALTALGGGIAGGMGTLTGKLNAVPAFT